MEKEKKDKEFEALLRALDEIFLSFGTIEEMELHDTITILEKLRHVATFRKADIERALDYRKFHRKNVEGKLYWIVYIR